MHYSKLHHNLAPYSPDLELGSVQTPPPKNISLIALHHKHPASSPELGYYIITISRNSYITTNLSLKLYLSSVTCDVDQNEAFLLYQKFNDQATLDEFVTYQSITKSYCVLLIGLKEGVALTTLTVSNHPTSTPVKVVHLDFKQSQGLPYICDETWLGSLHENTREEITRYEPEKVYGVTEFGLMGERQRNLPYNLTILNKEIIEKVVKEEEEKERLKKENNADKKSFNRKCNKLETENEDEIQLSIESDLKDLTLEGEKEDQDKSSSNSIQNIGTTSESTEAENHDESYSKKDAENKGCREYHMEKLKAIETENLTKLTGPRNSSCLISVLQCLIDIPAVRNCIFNAGIPGKVYLNRAQNDLYMELKRLINTKRTQSVSTFRDTLSELYPELSDEKKEHDPIHLYKNFLKMLRDIDISFKKEGRYSNFNLAQLFTIQTQFNISCEDCDNKNKLTKNLDYLRSTTQNLREILEVNPDFEDLFQNSLLDQIRCNECLNIQKFVSQIAILKFPEVLVVKCSKKLSNEETNAYSPIPITLSIDSQYKTSESADSIIIIKTQYTLQGIVSQNIDRDGHHHYAADSRHHSDKQWYRYDGISVYRYGMTQSEIHVPNPYMLFYLKN